MLCIKYLRVILNRLNNNDQLTFIIIIVLFCKYQFKLAKYKKSTFIILNLNNIIIGYKLKII